MPEWGLIVLCLAAVSALGILWTPLFACAPLFAGVISLPLAQALVSASHAQFPSRPRNLLVRLQMITFTAVLFVVQPAARLWGRTAFGLTPWRRKNRAPSAVPRVQVRRTWNETWRCPQEWLRSFEAAVMKNGWAGRGGDFDTWDIQIRGGLAGSARVHLGVEEHGAGRQLLQWRIQPVFSWFVALLAVCLLVLSIIAGRASELAAASTLAVLALAFCFWVYCDCSVAFGVALEALKSLEEEELP